MIYKKQNNSKENDIKYKNYDYYFNKSLNYSNTNSKNDNGCKPMFSYKKYIEEKSNKLKFDEDSNSEFEKPDENSDSQTELDESYEKYNNKNKFTNAIDALVRLKETKKNDDESSEKYIDKAFKKVNKIVDDYASDDFEHINYNSDSDSDSDYEPCEFPKKKDNKCLKIEDCLGTTDKIRKKNII